MLLCAGNPVTGGIFTQIDAGGSCEFQPDVQKINFYKLELCTEAPIGPTTSTIADNSKCVTFYQNDDGSFVTVKRNAGTQIGRAEDYSLYLMVHTHMEWLQWEQFLNSKQKLLLMLLC